MSPFIEALNYIWPKVKGVQIISIIDRRWAEGSPQECFAAVSVDARHIRMSDLLGSLALDENDNGYSDTHTHTPKFNTRSYHHCGHEGGYEQLLCLPIKITWEKRKEQRQESKT